MSDTFCVLPWYSKEIARDRSSTCCCLLPAEHNIDDIKNALLSGQQHSACTKCWDIESSGKTSRRQQENVFLDYILDRDIERIRQDCVDNTATILLYQLYISNLCNQACVTCNSNASSKWSNIESRMGIVPYKLLPVNTKFLIDYKNAKRIEILGGEPMFDPKIFEILDNLILHNNTDCVVSFVTNGSIELKKSTIDQFNRFKNLNICVSIDGIGPVFEYLRWPGRWETLLKNIEQYRSIADNLSVSYTISAVNAFYYDQTVSWFEQNSLPYNHNIVTSPSWASLADMPIRLKQALQSHNNFVTGFCNEHGQENSMSMLAEQLCQQDQAKKISIKDYMPEVADIIFSSQ